MSWLTHLHRLCTERQPCVLVTVAGTRGSTPREVGAKMIVTATDTIGTIGGGQLEYLCTQSACAWLQHEPGDGRSKLMRFPLGASCGQCCGGVVEILFEEITPAQYLWVEQLIQLKAANTPALMLTARKSGDKSIITAKQLYRFAQNDAYTDATLETLIALLNPRTRAHSHVLPGLAQSEVPVLIEPMIRNDFHIALFGAGHVGSACVQALSMLDAHIDLIDARPMITTGSYPENVRALHVTDPVAMVDRLPADTYYLVMTHDHAQDLELCAQILQRQDVAYCGLIGSRSKRRRFERRFTSLGLNAAQLSKLVCPIGIEQIQGKKPHEIALAVAAQILALREVQIASFSAPHIRLKAL